MEAMRLCCLSEPSIGGARDAVRRCPRAACPIMLSLTYISECLIEPVWRAATVAQIAADARRRNAARCVTGALLYAGNRFAQTIEGADADVDNLMARIAADPRHRILAIVERHPITARRMAGWAMVYSGDSIFVTRSIARAMSDGQPSSPADVDRLLQIIRAFTLDPRRQLPTHMEG